MRTSPLWMLVSDIHFKIADLDRIVRTGKWVASIPDHYNISRAVICGDLLQIRTAQNTKVLSECYRFLNKLANNVPHVNIILGNHDLAYSNDYETSALEALSNQRMAPYITLHRELGCHEWNGRRVLVMPYREDQREIVKYVHDLDPKVAAKTVGFAHLALNRAITQKHFVHSATGEQGPALSYSGLTGIGEFAPLARTFTGHFHNHQTILQAPNQQSGDPQGSITYIGAPLQLDWGDLFDDAKGVVLLNPETLEYELVRNPHREGYVTVDAQDVLAGKVQAEEVQYKHVMIIGKLSNYNYLTARNQLIKLGVRSVREKRPFEQEWATGQRRIGQTVLPADIQVQPRQEREGAWEDTQMPQSCATIESTEFAAPASSAERPRRNPIDMGKLAQDYVHSVKLEPSLEDKQETLAIVGERLTQIASFFRDKTGCTATYKNLLDLSTPFIPIPADDTPRSTTTQNIFEADLSTLEITNFLGVQGTLKLDFRRNLKPGMNFIMGNNGAGKSTIIEAITWCQFGSCIREGLMVGDVVNDTVRENCSVRLTFANGYTISRHRKHRQFKNRVIVERDGVVQPEFEASHTRITQSTINALLGIDFDTFARTIVLGSESTRSFLSATQAQKKQLIESALGLEILNACTEACNAMINQVNEELSDKESKLENVRHTIGTLKRRARDQARLDLKRLIEQVQSHQGGIERAELGRVKYLKENERKMTELRRQLKAEQDLPSLEPELSRLQAEVALAEDEAQRLSALSTLAQARLSIDREVLDMNKAIKAIFLQLDHLEEELEGLLGANNTLEVPNLPFVGDYEGSRNRTSRVQGFLSSVTFAIRKVWASFLDIISPRRGEARRRWQKHTDRIAELETSLTRTKIQDRITEMTSKLANLSRDTARQSSISENDVHAALRTLTVQEALRVPRQFKAAVDTRKTLVKRHDQLRQENEKKKQSLQRRQHDLEMHEKETDKRHRSWEESLEKYDLSVGSIEREINACRQRVESDTQLLAELARQEADLSGEAATVGADQEIFAFWQDAFTRRNLQTSRPTFRRHVIRRHRSELNKLLGEIIMVMYRDTYYAQRMTSGTIEALFREEEGGGNEVEDEDGHRQKGSLSAEDEHGEDGHDKENADKTSVLEPSLLINPALEYAKKSGGERKRVDLALFFALFALGESRSPHVARYLLVDEAFDNLDAAGRAAVLKWCRWMAERLTHVLIVTHNTDLVALANRGSEGADGGGIAANVVTIRAGHQGTEIVVDEDV